MSAKQHPHRSGGTVNVTTSTLLIAVALLGTSFTMLIAASYPGTAAAVTMSSAFVAALGQSKNRLTVSPNSKILTPVLQRLRIARLVLDGDLDS